MTLHEALDKCSICDLFNKNVSDEYKMQVIDKVMSAPNTKVPKVKLSCLIAWLLKKVGWQEKRIEELDKENGKLEGKLADLQSEYFELENFHNNEVNELKEQLTKAKEIIEKLIS